MSDDTPTPDKPAPDAPAPDAPAPDAPAPDAPAPGAPAPDAPAPHSGAEEPSSAPARPAPTQTPPPPADAPERTGYGRPPKHSRWPPGHCPNPKGRPKGSKNFDADAAEALDMPVPINDNGKARNVSSQLAALLRLREKALKGEARMLEFFIALARERSDKDAAKRALAERRALEEHELKLLAEAMPRLVARLAGKAAPS